MALAVRAGAARMTRQWSRVMVSRSPSVSMSKMQVLKAVFAWELLDVSGEGFNRARHLSVRAIKRSDAIRNVEVKLGVFCAVCQFAA